MKNYLIYGEDLFLIKKQIDNIINNNNDINIVKYNMNETEIDNVVIDADTYDLFGGKKIIILEECVFLSSEAKKDINYNTDLLLKYLNNPNKDCTLIISLNNNVDERKKIVKEIKKLCEIIVCNNMNSNEIYSYIKNKFENNNYIIDNKSIDLIIKKIGTNISLIDNEIEKLMMYKFDDKKIIINDVMDVVSENITDNIFDLIDSIIENDKTRIFNLYNKIVNINGEEITKVIIMIANQFRLILQSKILSEQGLSEALIAQKLKVHPYRIKLALKNSKKLEKNKLLSYLDQLCSLDFNIKSGNTNKSIGLELFLLNM